MARSWIFAPFFVGIFSLMVGCFYKHWPLWIQFPLLFRCKCQKVCLLHFPFADRTTVESWEAIHPANLGSPSVSGLTFMGDFLGLVRAINISQATELSLRQFMTEDDREWMPGPSLDPWPLFFPRSFFIPAVIRIGNALIRQEVCVLPDELAFFYLLLTEPVMARIFLHPSCVTLKVHYMALTQW